MLCMASFSFGMGHDLKVHSQSIARSSYTRRRYLDVSPDPHAHMQAKLSNGVMLQRQW